MLAGGVPSVCLVRGVAWRGVAWALRGARLVLDVVWVRFALLLGVPVPLTPCLLVALSWPWSSATYRVCMLPRSTTLAFILSRMNPALLLMDWGCGVFLCIVMAAIALFLVRPCSRARRQNVKSALTIVMLRRLTSRGVPCFVL